MSTTEITANVPAHEIDNLKSIALAAGATRVQVVPEPDGEFTLITEFPDAAQSSTKAAVAPGGAGVAAAGGGGAAAGVASRAGTAPVAASAAVAQPAAAATPAAAGPSAPQPATSLFAARVAAASAQLAAPAWWAVAHAELGVQELPGAASNPRIEAYFATTQGGAAADDVPWCSAFVNWCISQTGLAGTGSRRARSWLAWGEPLTLPVPGCVVVLSRGAPPQGHVGFYAGMDGSSRVWLLGGNQHNGVHLGSFALGRVIGFRRPTATALAAAGLGADGRRLA